MRDIQIGRPSPLVSAIRMLPFRQYDFFRIWNRLLKGINYRVAAKTYFGSTIYCSASEFIQNCIMHFGVWEPDISALIEREVSPGDTVVDVGANIGYVSLLASSIVGSSGEVIAIEASPSIFEALSRNIEANGATNIKAIQVAVSDKGGMLRLYRGHTGDCGTSTTCWRDGADLEAEVPTRTLDEILTPAQRQSVRFLKIDVEGGELPILQRLMDTLDFYSPTIRVLVEFCMSDPGAARLAFDRMRSLGFKAYAIINIYDRRWYLSWKKPTPWRELDMLPHEQTDILFLR